MAFTSPGKTSGKAILNLQKKTVWSYITPIPPYLPYAEQELETLVKSIIKSQVTFNLGSG